MTALRVLTLTLCFAMTAVAADGTGTYCEQHVAESIKVPATANRAYRLLVPEGAQDSGEKLPLVVYLHGAGAKGDDNAKPITEVLPRLLASAELRKKFQCFVLLPQCRAGDSADGRPKNWVQWKNQQSASPAEWLISDDEPTDQLRGAMAALDDVLTKQPVDSSRIYLTGVSMGGSGAWYWSALEPNNFAAVLTACGLSETSKAKSLIDTPLWAFHGSKDDVAPVRRSREMIAAIKAAGGSPKFTELTGVGHNIAAKSFTHDDHAALRWLFEQRRMP